MKIHGKILNYYLLCSASVDKEGFLYKKGEVNTSYQRRWCVLQGNLLFYKDRPGEREHLGVIVLEGCSVQLCESEEKFAFSLVFNEPGLRTYKFAAEDQYSQEAWIKALLLANHGYLHLLLKDLTQQYQEACQAAGESVVDPRTLSGGNLLKPHLQAPSSVFYTQVSNQRARDSLASSSQLLQAGLTQAKAASKKSPKLWPKRNAAVAPVNGPPPPKGEWSEPTQDFRQLHEDFGKEVRELIVNWSTQKQEEVAVKSNLIDLN